MYFQFGGFCTRNDDARPWREADTLLLLHAADVSARNPFTELHIYSPDTDVFLLTIHKYPILCASTAFKTGSGKHTRTILIR